MAYIEDINLIWEAVKDILCEEMPESSVRLWFGELKVLAYEDNTVYFGIDSEFKYEIIHSKEYDKIIARGFENILGFPVRIDVKFTGDPNSSKRILLNIANELKKEHDEEERKKREEEVKEKARTRIPHYIFEYTFDNFIVGGTNKFAHAACYAVAQNPAKNYNPLFIYGPSGLGKTHLLYAIMHEVRRNNPDAKIIYMKGDDFTNQMIESLSKQEMKEFHDKYRSCDILLIDDIQFIAGKVATQEEFFHTFNTLYEEHKQIILTSDRPPREIKTLEDRLKTRFEWGLIADIQPPDLELRIAIIKKKAEQVGAQIGDEVLLYLAENLRSNIRQLEGAIKKLAALSFLAGEDITMHMAESCISELLGGAEPTTVTVDKIFGAVYKRYGVSKEEILGKKRDKDIAFARHLSCYLIKDITEMSYPTIGKMLDKHHTTIMSSIGFIEKKLVTDPSLKHEIIAIKKDVTGIDTIVD